MVVVEDGGRTESQDYQQAATSVDSPQPKTEHTTLKQTILKNVEKYESWANSRFKAYDFEIAILKGKNTTLLEQNDKPGKELVSARTDTRQAQDLATTTESKVAELEAEAMRSRRAHTSEDASRRIKELETDLKQEQQDNIRFRDRIRGLNLRNDDLQAFKDRVNAAAQGEDRRGGQTGGGRRDSGMQVHSFYPPAGPRDMRWR